MLGKVEFQRFLKRLKTCVPGILRYDTSMEKVDLKPILKFKQAVDVEKAPLVLPTCESNAVFKRSG
jgi:hypothetical protein